MTVTLVPATPSEYAEWLSRWVKSNPAPRGKDLLDDRVVLGYAAYARDYPMPSGEVLKAIGPVRLRGECGVAAATILTCGYPVTGQLGHNHLLDPGGSSSAAQGPAVWQETEIMMLRGVWAWWMAALEADRRRFDAGQATFQARVDHYAQGDIARAMGVLVEDRSVSGDAACVAALSGAKFSAGVRLPSGFVLRPVSGAVRPVGRGVSGRRLFEGRALVLAGAGGVACAEAARMIGGFLG